MSGKYTKKSLYDCTLSKSKTEMLSRAKRGKKHPISCLGFSLRFCIFARFFHNLFNRT